MELIISKIDVNFNNQELFKYSSPVNLKLNSLGNFKDLDSTKGLIDLLDKSAEKNRRASVKYLHEYELVKLICKKQVISRAYFKLYEIVYHEPIILKEQLNCFFICEAPGGFIEAVTDIRRKKNLRTDFISISKFDYLIKYDRYLEETRLMYGDITNIHTLLNTIEINNKRYPNGLDLITADGGFDIKVFEAQETLSTQLLLCEIYLAIKTQKRGGMFIIKFFDMFTHNSIVYYLLLCEFYQNVKITKPKTSRNCNSERYLVCYNFKGITESQDQDLMDIIKNFKLGDQLVTIVYPNLILDEYLLKRVCTFNNLIIHEQIKTIKESIKMVNSKGYYYDLLIRIFSEKRNTLSYKGILSSRIKKCTDFLRSYNININQLI
jgi:23S rRNA U2552 (ribose-2'-O)-methylase RlmE/FtsJ